MAGCGGREKFVARKVRERATILYYTLDYYTTVLLYYYTTILLYYYTLEIRVSGRKVRERATIL